MTIIKWKECHPFFYVYRINAGESPWKDGLLVAINTADNPFQVEGNSITGWKKYNYNFLKQLIKKTYLSSHAWRHHIHQPDPKAGQI